MKASIYLPRPGEDGGDSADALVEMAQAVETAGLDACSLTDHPFPSIDETTTGHHALDPMVALGYLAAATSRIQLHTNALVLPYRNPFLVAKASSTLDQLSRGRLILGVASGYLEPEFRALGSDFAARGELMEEGLTAMLQAWTAEPVVLATPRWSAHGNVMYPPPYTRPHPPIWVGGNGDKALDRAVRLGQGWTPFEAPHPRSAHVRTVSVASLGDLRRRVQKLHQVVAAHGRTEPLEICYTRRSTGWLSAPERTIDEEIRELADIGVTWVGVRVDAASKEHFIDRVVAFGEILRRSSATRI